MNASRQVSVAGHRAPSEPVSLLSARPSLPRSRHTLPLSRWCPLTLAFYLTPRGGVVIYYTHRALHEVGKSDFVTTRLTEPVYDCMAVKPRPLPQS